MSRSYYYPWLTSPFLISMVTVASQLMACTIGHLTFPRLFVAFLLADFSIASEFTQKTFIATGDNQGRAGPTFWGAYSQNKIGNQWLVKKEMVAAKWALLLSRGRGHICCARRE